MCSDLPVGGYFGPQGAQWSYLRITTHVQSAAVRTKILKHMRTFGLFYQDGPHSSSLTCRPFWLPFAAASHTAGVPTSILYTHFSSSTIFHISSFSAQASTTSVLRFGPFQQCCPFSYLRVTLSPDPRPLPSGGTSSSTKIESMRTKVPIAVSLPPFLDFCFVLSNQHSS